MSEYCKKIHRFLHFEVCKSKLHKKQVYAGSMGGGRHASVFVFTTADKVQVHNCKTFQAPFQRNLFLFVLFFVLKSQI